jgi:heat shock protein HspQ
MTPTCYAQHLLNPFRGVMNIIEHEGAEAVTTDGLHRDIYVRDTTLVEDLADSHMVRPAISATATGRRSRA